MLRLPARHVLDFSKRAVPRFSRNVALLASASAASQVVAVAAMPLLTRLFGPNDFGVLALFASLVLVFSSFNSLRYEMAIPLCRSEDDAKGLLAVAGILVGVSSGLILCAVPFVAQTVAEALNAPGLASALWLLPVGLLGMGTYQAFYMLALRDNTFRSVARTRITQTLARVLTQGLLGIAGWGYLGLVIGDICGRTWGAGYLVRHTRDRPWRGILAAASRGNLWRLMRRYRRFAYFTAPASLVSVLSLEATPLLFSAAFDTRVAGLYGLTQRVLTLPMVVVGTAVGEAYLGSAPRLARETPHELRALVRRSVLQLLLLMAAPAVVLVIWAPALFGRVFGEEWTAAGQYARLLLPAMTLQLVTSPFSQTPNIFGRQELQFALTATRFVVLLAAFGMVALFRWTDTTAVALVSASTTTVYLAAGLVYWRLIVSRSRTTPSAVPGFATRGVQEEP